MSCKKGLNWGEEEIRIFRIMYREADYFINRAERNTDMLIFSNH